MYIKLHYALQKFKFEVPRACLLSVLCMFLGTLCGFKGYRLDSALLFPSPISVTGKPMHDSIRQKGGTLKVTLFACYGFLLLNYGLPPNLCTRRSHAHSHRSYARARCGRARARGAATQMPGSWRRIRGKLWEH